jgi:hypothetical protein
VTNKTPTKVNDLVQATILKKCDRANHRPEKNKGCAARDRGERAGACQHTCETAEIEKCSHKWTVRYPAHSVQGEKSFKTITEAEVWQLDLSAKKVTQGALFVDPNAGTAAKFGEVRARYAAKQDIGAGTLAGYMSGFRGAGLAKLMDDLPVATVALMTEEVDSVLNVRCLKKTRDYRTRLLRMVRDTLDQAVAEGLIPGHRIASVQLKTYRPNAEEWARSNAPWVFITDDQARMLAEGVTVVPGPQNGRKNRWALKGLGVVVWLMRCTGARIGEALGAEKADFEEAEDGTYVWHLRWQASDDGRELVAIKHRPAGHGRDVPILAMVWEMIQALPDGPVCPGATKTRYMCYETAARRLQAIARVAGIKEGWHAHNLRHQFASEEVASGVHVADLSGTLGHKSPEITFRRYVRSTPGRLDRMADRMKARWDAAARGSGEGHQDDSAAPLSLAA